MAFFKLSKLPKPQGYEYRPRYWNPQKEALEERLKQIEESKEGDTEAVKMRIASNFRRGGYAQRGGMYKSRQNRQSNRTLLLVVAVLVLLSYWLLSVYLPELVKVLE